MNYQTMSHAKHVMVYHLLFLVCKYRTSLLEHVGEAVKASFPEISTRSQFRSEAVEADQNHMHCLVRSEAQLSPWYIVRRWRQSSTY
jgi:putative transposase